MTLPSSSPLLLGLGWCEVVRLPTCPRAMLVLMMTAWATGVLGAEEPVRVKIGQVLGRSVYRDEMRPGQPLRDEVQRLFIVPVEAKYRQDHRKDCEPTREELEAAARYFHRKKAERMAGAEGPQIRESLERLLRDLKVKLAAPDLDEAAKRGLEEQKESLEKQLANDLDDHRRFVAFWVPPQSFARHLYTKYGGGRVLMTKFGVMAFDAHLQWAKERERLGEFTIEDAELRRSYFDFWARYERTPRVGTSFISAKPEHVRTLTEPEWLREDKAPNK